MDALAEQILSLRDKGFRIRLHQEKHGPRHVGILVEDLEGKSDGAGVRLIVGLRNAFRSQKIPVDLVLRPYDASDLLRITRDPAAFVEVKSRLSAFSSGTLQRYLTDDEEKNLRDLYRLVSRGMRKRRDFR